jgi:hypothetical protein
VEESSKRSGSESRKRNERVTIRVTEEEQKEMSNLAKAAGMTIPEMVRNLVFKLELVRPIEEEKIEELLEIIRELKGLKKELREGNREEEVGTKISSLEEKIEALNQTILKKMNVLYSRKSIVKVVGEVCSV